MIAICMTQGDSEAYRVTKMDTEKFIQCVKEYPVLYDKRHPGNRDYTKKAKIWVKISKEMCENTEVVRSKWKGLCDTYRKYKNQIKRVEDGETFTKSYINWCWAPLLQFLDTCREHNSTLNNARRISFGDSSLDSESSASSKTPQKNLPTSPIQTLTDCHKPLESSESDSLTETKPASSRKQTKLAKPHRLPKKKQKISVQNKPKAEVFEDQIGMSDLKLKSRGSCTSDDFNEQIRNSDFKLKTSPEHIVDDFDVPIQTPIKRSRKNTSDDFGENYCMQNEYFESTDPIDLLFRSYAETFKKFSIRKQAVLKVHLAQLFSDAEIEELQESSMGFVSRVYNVNGGSLMAGDPLNG